MGEECNETIEEKDAEGFTTFKSKRLSKISNENEETKENSKTEATEPSETKEPEIVEDRQTDKKSSWHQTDSETRCLESKKNIREFSNVNEEKNTVYEGDCDNEIENNFTDTKEESKKDDKIFSDEKQVPYVEKHTESRGALLTEETKIGIKEEYSKEREVICDILSYVSINTEEKQGKIDIDTNQTEDIDNDTIKENDNGKLVIHDVEVEKADKENLSVLTEVTDVVSETIENKNEIKIIETYDEDVENYMAKCANEDRGKEHIENSPTENTNNASKDKCDVRCDVDKDIGIEANVTDKTNTVLDIQKEKEYEHDKEIGISQIADGKVVETSQLEFQDANKDETDIKCDVDKNIDIEADVIEMSHTVLDVQKEKESKSDIEIG